VISCSDLPFKIRFHQLPSYANCQLDPVLAPFIGFGAALRSE